MRRPVRVRPVFALALPLLACRPLSPALPEIRVENVVCPEGTGGTTPCVIPVRLSAAGAADAVFRLTVDAGASTALSPADYAFAGGELTIPAGATALDASLSIVGDAEVEPDEVVALKLELVSGATPAAINGTGARLTIANDDVAPTPVTIAMENRLCPEGDAGSSTCAVTVRLSGPAPAPVTFLAAVASSGSTATLAVDFLFAATRVTIPAGVASAEVPLTITGDREIEPDEVVALALEELSGATPAEINGTGARVTITNDDVAPPSSRALGAARFAHTVTKLADGRLLIAGGQNEGGPVATTALLSADGTTVTPGPALPEARASHSATRLADGRVLLAGGLTSGSNVALASTVLCDAAASACTRGPEMANGRMLHAAVELADHRVLLAGGVPEYGAPGDLAAAELFVAAGGGQPDRFVPAENDLPSPSDSTAAALLPDGEVLLAGGAGPGTSVQLVRYRPGAGFSRDASTLRFGHVNGTASALADGRILVAGGMTAADRACEFVALDADPALPLRVTEGPLLAESRYFHVAVPLAGDRVLMTGGYVWDPVASRLSARSSVEIFSPAAGALTGGFTASSSLGAARAQFGAALLDNGFVAHVGGVDGVRPSATIDLLRP